MRLFRSLIFLTIFVSLNLWAQEYEMSNLTVKGRRDEGPLVQDSAFKAETVDPQKFADPTRQSLADLVKDQVGVDAQTYCANCGAKRLTINGLKGEHTSILVDGVPLHSAVSSFYGVDTIPLLGIGEVQVMRGAGASLTNPEAIGGTLNIITVDPLDSKSKYSTSLGVDDRFHGKSQNHSILWSNTDEAKRNGIVIGGQFSRSETWDVDSNNIAESPQRQNSSVLLKTRNLVGNKHDISTRFSYATLEILGGYWRPSRPSQVRESPAGQNDFEGGEGDVDADYIGDPAKVTDWINLERYETAATGTYHMSERLTAEWKLGYARQEQKAIYQHGFDYANIDNLFVGDTHLHFAPNSEHILKAGLFVKDQKLRSASQKLFEDDGLPKDSFNFSSYAAYGQLTVFASDTVEFDFALRFDRIDVNWVDEQLDNRVSETVLAPRLQYMHNFNEHLTQRMSYGLGYRAPLTFFESQHGNEENGYQVDITELEKAHSVVTRSATTPPMATSQGVPTIPT
jgi:outer membrane receptor for ferrienterochelin and colicins